MHLSDDIHYSVKLVTNVFSFVRHALEIRYPWMPLIEAIKVEKHSDHFSSEDDLVPHVHLIPELCYILPIPRDLLFVMGSVDKVMPHLERQINMKMLLGAFARQNAPNHSDDIIAEILPTFASLVDESSRIYPKATYQRLEFLGDAVLSYFLCTNVVAHNSTLRWDADDIGDIIAKAAKNRSLAPASLRLGLPRLVLASKLKWRSAYRKDYSTSVCDTVDVPDSILSDLFESFLAATYLCCTGDNTELGVSLISAALNVGCLPFPSMNDGMKWFAPLDSCLKRGYPFDQDECWKDQLSAIGCIFAGNKNLSHRVHQGALIIQRGLHMSNVFAVDEIIESEQGKLLLYCALFDDPLDRGGSTDDEMTSIALLRDLLYHVGVWSFKLCITKEVFARFPAAEPTDLHLTMSSVNADDVVAYVMVKSMMHHALYYELSYADLEHEIVMADIRGREIFWNRNGGWTLGMTEFLKRSKVGGSPRYPGICGGRFCGRESKLATHLTDDLVFSFKAIFGAFVLSIGLDKTWDCFQSFFDEILLLSADELRKVFNDSSTLVRSY